MKTEHIELLKKHLPGIMPKLQKVLDESELKSLSIHSIKFTDGMIHCPGGCPRGQTCTLIIDDTGSYYACR